MPKTIEELAAIARVGGGFEIDAADYEPREIKPVLGKMCEGAAARIRNAYLWSQEDLVSVAQHGTPGVVIYVF